MRLTLGIAALHTVHLIAIAAIILTLPIDTAKGLLAVLAGGFDVAIPALVITGFRRVVDVSRRRSQPPPIRDGT